MERFGHSLRVSNLEFYKEAIFDGCICENAQYRCFFFILVILETL